MEVVNEAKLSSIAFPVLIEVTKLCPVVKQVHLLNLSRGLPASFSNSLVSRQIP